MPTAAKLAAAILFALVAFVAAHAVMSLMPAGMLFGVFDLICAAIGALVGWRVMGVRVGRGMSVAAGAGIATSFVIVFWALFVFATDAMIRNSVRLRYDGPFDAIVGAFGIAADYAVVVAQPVVLAVLLVGGALSGVAVEWVSRHWR